MMMKRCLRRLIESRRVLWSLETTYYQRFVVSANFIDMPTNSSAFSSRGLANYVIPNPGNICYHSEETKGRCDGDIEILAIKEKQLRIIEKGDVVNLSELLFTENRDYLIRYNDPQLVTAEQLAGKVVVLYFVRYDPYSSHRDTSMASLIDVYNDLKPKNCFEVVFVFVDDAFGSMNGRKSSLQKETQIFEDIFSLMPWTAIPVSDIKLREILGRRFGLQLLTESSYPIGIVIDSTGMVLHTSCEHIIDRYGSPAFPFSEERLAFLDSEDDIISVRPSLRSLLVSPQRDHVISNKGEKVPIHTLEDKVVALFFYEDDFSCNISEELKVAYEELGRNHKNFEVVLIYLTDTYYTCKHTKEKFNETFKTMPWLALPFKDPVHKKLKRLFDYPKIVDPDMWKRAPSLIIFGPHGEFIEPCGAEVLSYFGVSAYPFTREQVVKIETTVVLELKLEMLFSPTTVFKRKDGSQVQFSHFAGKRVLLYLESLYWNDIEDLVTVEEVKFLKMLKEVDFLKMLKERYLQLKGTSDEFEVIYISYQDDKICYNELVADVPWFVSPASELFEEMPDKSAFLTYYGKNCFEYECSFLLAFGQDGGLVRRTVCPKFKHLDFPFYAGSLEDEAYVKINQYFFDNGYWDMGYQGLLRNSFIGF